MTQEFSYPLALGTYARSMELINDQEVLIGTYDEIQLIDFS